MHWAIVVLLLGGCDRAFGLGPVSGDAVVAPDGAAGGPIDGSTPCYGRNGPGGAGLFQFCTNTSVPFPTLSTTTFNTDQDPICEPSAAAACVIVSPVIDIIGTVNAVGSRPLVLISTTTLTVMGTIDVSSNTTAQNTAVNKGAGADDTTCTPPHPSLESSGGPGGTFGTPGGAGGGSSVTSATPIGTVDKVRGGCPGSNGTIGEDSSAGAGGASGGAVYLIAGTSITIGDAAVVNASGALGFGGPHDANDDAFPGGGGGGGGAGGLIGFDAPTVTVAGIVMANGAGGAVVAPGPTPRRRQPRLCADAIARAGSRRRRRSGLPPAQAAARCADTTSAKPRCGDQLRRGQRRRRWLRRDPGVRGRHDTRAAHLTACELIRI